MTYIVENVQGWSFRVPVFSSFATDIRRDRRNGYFRECKEHDAYQKAFERLLRDLEAEIQTASS